MTHTTSQDGRRRALALLLGHAALLTCGSAHAKDPNGSPSTAASLDDLVAQRLSVDNTTVVLTPTTKLRFTALVESLPKAGKTDYMIDTLAARRITPASPVTHKMWVRSAAGARAMLYVPSDLGERIASRFKAGDAVAMDVTQLWNSRHGPGLLLRSMEAAAR